MVLAFYSRAYSNAEITYDAEPLQEIPIIVSDLLIE